MKYLFSVSSTGLVDQRCYTLKNIETPLLPAKEWIVFPRWKEPPHLPGAATTGTATNVFLTDLLRRVIS